MEYTAAYGLLSVNNKEFDQETVKQLFSSIGVTTDEKVLKHFSELIKGKTYDELLSQGKEKLATIAVAAPVAAVVETKVEEKKVKEKAPPKVVEESSDGDLFDF